MHDLVLILIVLLGLRGKLVLFTAFSSDQLFEFTPKSIYPQSVYVFNPILLIEFLKLQHRLWQICEMFS